MRRFISSLSVHTNMVLVHINSKVDMSGSCNYLCLSKNVHMTEDIPFYQWLDVLPFFLKMYVLVMSDEMKKIKYTYMNMFVLNIQCTKY